MDKTLGSQKKARYKDGLANKKDFLEKNAFKMNGVVQYLFMWPNYSGATSRTRSVVLPVCFMCLDT